MSGPDRVTVALGARSYDIVIGENLLADAGTYLAPVLNRPAVFIVTDQNVARHHLATLTGALDRAGIEHRAFVLPPGEATKDFAHLQALLDDLLDAGTERSDMIVALGGGVIGDLAGFAASILRRGADFVQIPTTLLAQVDSSVGGKTGIDTRQGKNLVGAFHQPRLVLADLALLQTLPRRELLAGYAEVAKYGLVGDEAFFGWLEVHGKDVVGGAIAAQRHAVAVSCAAKADIVARDETESGARALLNLGHTFGHALETEAAYGAALLHGEAVAIGMVLAFALSVRLELCPGQDAERVRRHLADVGLPVHPSDIKGVAWRADRIVAHMQQDKKVKAGRPAFVLARAIGQAFVTREVDLAEVEGFLADILADP
jgi:3-dehydroquinate synthase